MADVNANIGVNIDASNALAQLKSLQRQLSQFHTSVAKSSSAAASAQASFQKNLVNSINATGAFSAELRTVRTTSEAFTNSLEKNKFSMREYFRYAGAATKTFGKTFQSEFDTIGKVAEDRVKKLQTQYIKLGRDTNGAMKAIAVIPNQLDLSNHSTQLQLAAQKQAIFNQLLKQGSTNLLNFGKNTQWAGRQLMVGFTLPLASLGMVASKSFMDMENAALKFRKVYGDLLTPQSETQQALENIQELAQEFTKYGVAVSQTVGLAAEAAAAGFQGLDLQRQTIQATRLSILGQIDSQQALGTTIALQNAFKMSSEDLADSINFLNAVENQTVVSLDDITTAIPKVAPVIQQLGGDVKDLAFFMTAMKQGGINASEGANALKSGLASLINPTNTASKMLASMGINIKSIVESNQGDLKSTVIDFALALDKLDPLNRARAIEQMFGKFQFARLSALFSNVIADGTQASRVLDLAGASIEDLSALSESELAISAGSAMNKFKKAVEDLKFALVPVGEAFLQAVTPILEFFGNILEKFAGLSDNTKKIITVLTIAIGGIGPVALMAFGLLANGLANIIKLFATLRNGYLRLTGQSAVLGEQTQYMTTEQLEAAAAAHSLNQSHANLTQTFTAESGAVRQLIAAYTDATRAASQFAMANPGMMLPGRGKIAKKFAQGGIISGPGGPTSDSVPVMASNGEAIISAKTVKKYPGMVAGLIAGNVPGFRQSGKVGSSDRIGSGSSGRIGKSGTTVLRPYLENVSNTGGLVGFENINPSDLADVASIYVKEIMAEGKVSAAGITKEMDLWKTQNISAISAAQAAVDSGESATKAFGPLAEKFKVDMEASGGEVHKFNTTAQRMMPKLQADLIQAQTKSRELSLNLKSAADATKLAESLPGNIVAKNAATPGPFSARSRARQAAVLSQSGAAGIETYGIPRFMLPANVDPKSRSNKLSTSQEHFSTTNVQEANLRTQAKIRQEAKANASVYKKATKQSGLSDMYVESRDRKSPHPLAAKDGKADAIAYQNAVNKSIERQKRKLAKQNKSISSIGPNTPAGATMLPIVSKPSQSDLRRTAIRDRARSVGGRVAGSMSGGRGMGISSGAMIASQFLPGKAGQLAGQASGALFAVQALQMLPGPLKLVAAGALAVAGGMKLLNSVQEKNRQKVEAFGDAIKTTTDQTNFLAERFGFTAKGNALSRFKDTVATSAPQRAELESLKNDPAFKEAFKTSISGISKLSGADAKTALQFKSAELLSQGMSAESVEQIMIAIQEEAGKSNLNINFKNIKLDKEGLGKLASQVGVISQETGDKISKSFEKFDGLFAATLTTQESNSVTEQAVMENYEVAVKKAAASVASFSNTLANLAENGNLTGDQLQSSLSIMFTSLGERVKSSSGQMLIFKTALTSINKDLGESVSGITKVSNAQAILAAATAGVGTEMIKSAVAAMTYSSALDDAAADRRKKGLAGFADAESAAKAGFAGNAAVDAEIKLEKLTIKALEVQKAMNDIFNGGSNTGGGVTGATEGLSTASKNYLKILDQEISALEKKRDANKEANNEMQRQIDLQLKQQDLTNQMKQAQISGDYLGAAFLGQQKRKNTLEFNQQTSENTMEAAIKRIEERIAELKDGKPLRPQEIKKMKKANGGYIKSFMGGGNVSGRGTGKSDSIPAMLSNGEYVIQADSVNKYGQALFDSLNAQKFAQGGMPNATGMGLDWLGKTLFKSGNSVIKNLLGFDITKPMNEKSKMEFLSMALLPVPGGGTAGKVASRAVSKGVTAGAAKQSEAMKYFMARGNDGDISLVDLVFASTLKNNKKDVKGMLEVTHDPWGISTLNSLFSSTGPRATKDMLGLSLMLGAGQSGITKTGIALMASADRSLYSEALVKGLEKRGLGNVIGLTERNGFTTFGDGLKRPLNQRDKMLKNLSNDKDLMENSFEIPEVALNASREALSNLLKTGYNQSQFKELLKIFNKSMKGKEGFAMGGLVNLPKFHDWNGPVPGTYGQELPAMLKSGTEGIYQERYINDLQQAASNTTNSANSVYNVSMTIDGGNSSPKEIAEEVMKKMQVIANKNNKTNAGLR